jgi:hypothetical protein
MPDSFSWSRSAPPQQELPGPNPWARQAPRNAAARFLGGSPIAVFFRLLFASMLVGALLVWLDISPFEIFANLRRLVDYVWSLGSTRCARSGAMWPPARSSSCRSGSSCGS